MTTEEALKLIDGALAQLTTNREGHKRIQQAILQIEGALKAKDDEK